MPSDRKPWCCLCGAPRPDPMQVCPVSEHEMGAGRGLRHLIAHGRHSRAMAAFNGRAAASRAALDLATTEDKT